MRSDAASVEQYFAELPEDRRAAVAAVRETVLEHLPEGYEEGILHGMVSWHVPLERYPDTYNKQPLTLASLGNQKRHMALYLYCAYTDAEAAARFEERWAQSGRKLDMGKACVRFRKLDDVALDAVGEAIAQTPVEKLIDSYEHRRQR